MNSQQNELTSTFIPILFNSTSHARASCYKILDCLLVKMCDRDSTTKHRNDDNCDNMVFSTCTGAIFVTTSNLAYNCCKVTFE